MNDPHPFVFETDVSFFIVEVPQKDKLQDMVEQHLKHKWSKRCGFSLEVWKIIFWVQSVIDYHEEEINLH